MEPVVSLSTIWLISKVIGAVTTISGLIIGVFKMINWVRNKFINIDANVTALKATMETGFKNLNDGLTHQTDSVVGELKEQRADFRTFYAPSLLMMQQAAATITPQIAPVRAKRSAKKIARKGLTK